MSRDASRDLLQSEFADDPEMQDLVELFVSELPERVAVLRSGLESNALEECARVHAGGGVTLIEHLVATAGDARF